MLLWIFFFALVALGYQVWAWQQKARVQATVAVKRRCQQEGLQLLDDTLVLESMRLRRSEHGLRLWRCYRFEFASTGDQRYGGQIELLGRKIARLELSAYRSPDQLL